MAYFSNIIAACLALLVLPASAGYAQLAPPERFSGGPGDWRFAPSANDARYGKTAFQPAGLRVPVPGRPVTMPVSYRFAANAGRVAAGVVFMNPGLRFAAGVAMWLGLGKLIWDEAAQAWREVNGSLGAGTSTWTSPHDVPGFGSAVQACKSSFPTSTAKMDAGGASAGCMVSGSRLGTVNKSPGAGPCPTGWTDSPAGCLSPALAQPQFVETLDPQLMPDSVPWELPDGTPLPVEQPVINPEPGPDPLQRPKFVPTGDPVPNPNYDPNAAPSPQNQPFIQPGTRVVPSPTPTEPWRVDMQPVDRPVPTADPQPETDEGPGQANPGDKPKEDVPGLCDLYPDILACAKLDTPDAPDLPEKEKPSPAITPDSGWGAENASCPAPRILNVQGQQIAVPYDLFCQYMSGLRPIIIAMAWLSAGFILIGARGGD